MTSSFHSSRAHSTVYTHNEPTVAPTQPQDPKQVRDPDPMGADTNFGQQQVMDVNVDGDSIEFGNNIAGRTKEKEESWRIFPNMSGYRSLYTGNRDYDYEKKYPADSYGREAEEDARIWKVYLDEAEAYDDEMLKGSRDTINALLVFAALFSAVVTTFVVQTNQILQPDYGYIIANLLMEQIQLLRAAGNTTAIDTVSRSSVDIDSTSFSNTDVWINGLFFTSLALSLATALLSVLANQWLQAYTSLTSGSARERAMIRQFRYSGFEKWKMREIIGTLPIILHLSLAVFFVGLALFVSELQHQFITWIVVVIGTISFGAYLGSIVLPAIWIHCPYRIPMLFVPAQYILFPFSFMKYFLQLTYQTLLHSLAKYSIFRRYLTPLWSLYYEEFYFGRHNSRKPNSPSRPIGSLKSAELEWLKKHENLGCVVSDAFVWLSMLESNRSIQHIMIRALHGIFCDGYLENPVLQQIPFAKLAFTFRDLNSASVRHILGKLKFSIGDFAWGHYCCVDLAAMDGTDGWSIQKRIEAEKALLKYSSMEASTGSYLVEAARKGDPLIMKEMLGMWEETANSIDPQGETVLIAASGHGNSDIVRLLIDGGAAINAVGESKYMNMTALRAAVRGKHKDAIELLIRHGADVNKFDPLSDAITGGELDIVKLLMKSGAFISDVNGTALHVAVGTYNAKSDIVQFLLDEGADVNARGNGRNSSTPLQEAAFWGEETIIKLLIERGADVNAEGGPNGTALQITAYRGGLDTVKLFIMEGADVNATADPGGTALEAAAYRGRLDVVRCLLDNGADPNVKGGRYGSAIQAAKISPDLRIRDRFAEDKNAIIELLRQRGANE